MFEYFTREEADLFTFYRIPKELITNPKYENLSMGAKFLYGLLLDRNSLSRQNGWFDEQGHIFIYFSREEVMQVIKLGEDTVSKLFAELRKVELIQEVRQGQGKPNIIYVGRFTPTTPEKSLQVIEKIKNQKKSGSASRKNRVLNPEKIGANNTYLNETEGERSTHTHRSPENRTQEPEKTGKNIVCVGDPINLQKEIKKVTGHKIAIKKIEELLTSSTVDRILHHLDNWHIHKEHQKSEGAGWFITVVENDITPEKKRAGGTGKEKGKVLQRDNFEQRSYTRDYLESFYDDLTEDEPASKPKEPKGYTYVMEGGKQ